MCTDLLYSVYGCVACCVQISCTVCMDVLHVVYRSIVQCVWMCCMLCTDLLCNVYNCCTMSQYLIYNMYRSEQFLCNRSKSSLAVRKEPCLKAVSLWRTHENH